MLCACFWFQCCGDEKWGDWRPHLAMILSNLSSNVDVESRAMATMGDTLGRSGWMPKGGWGSVLQSETGLPSGVSVSLGVRCRPGARAHLLSIPLASKGLLDAAHFCYLMAQVGFGVYTKKTTKLVLIGSNHR